MTATVPMELKAWVQAQALHAGQTEDDVIVEALHVHNNLVQLLASEYPRLERFADREGLSLNGDLGAILARVVRCGLGARQTQDSGS